MGRMMSVLMALALAVMLTAISSAQAPASVKTLDIYFIDTEGGQATLYVSPSGQTLLVDTGNAGERDLTSHHGLDQSGSAAVVHAIQPRVAIVNNGTRKGGHVQTYQILESSPGLEDLWQLHWSYWGGVEHNAPGVMIANIDEPAQLAAIVSVQAAPGQVTGAVPPAGPAGNASHVPAHYLKVTARTDGSFTVMNSRNGYAKTYDARH